jgi:hypothetical protein
LQLNFKVTKELVERELTLDEQIALQEMALPSGEVRLRDLKSALARCMLTEDGKRMPYRAAMKTLGQLTAAEMKQTGEQVGAAIAEAAVPPETGTDS